MQTYRMDPLTEAERKRLGALWNSKPELVHLVGKAEVIFSSLSDPLGTWHQDERTVVISSSLIGTPHIDDVFLHEAAHALDYARRGVSLHDSEFHECCRILGVTEGFEKARVKIENEKKDHVLEKVRKLLALTSSPFENERTEAMKKAQALLAEHSLSLDNDEEKDELSYVILSRKKRYEIWEQQLFNLITLLTGAFILRDSTVESGTEIRAFGDEETAESAGFFWEYLTSALEREKKKAKKLGLDTRAWLYGLVDGLIARVSGTDEVTRALVLSSARSKETFRRITDGKIRHRSSKVRYDRESYRGGVGESKSLWIPPKKSRNGKGPKLLK